MPRLEAMRISVDKRVRVWVEDEHRYGLISVIRRYGTLKGLRPKVPYQTKFEWGYVYGALEVGSGQGEFLYTPTVSLEWSEVFLKQLVATDPQAIHVVIWDGAGFHLKEDSPPLPSAVRVLPLPAYSPELNPVESLWDPLKRRIANDTWDTLEEIEEAITEVLRPFWQKVSVVKSLLGDTWLTRGVGDFLSQRNRIVLN